MFLPPTGPYGLVDHEKVFAAGPDRTARARTSSRSAASLATGAVVVVRPDQYVAAVMPLAATDELRAFFEPVLSHRMPSSGQGAT